MNDMPKISVIVPIFNMEEYLNKCISSIVNQTYKNLEIILVNDGSSDASKLICDSYARIDKRIKVIHKINGGVSSARNEGLKYASGSYIGFVDPDDYINPEFYQILYENMIKYNVDISIVNYNIVIGGKVKKNKIKNDEVINKMGKYDFYKNLLKNYYRGFLWNKLYKRELIIDNGGNTEFLDKDIYFCEDLLYNVKIAKNAEKIYFDNRCLYNYNIRLESMTNSEFNSNRITVLDASKKVIDIVSNEYPELSILYKESHLNASLMLYYEFKKNYANKKILDKIKENIQMYYKEIIKSKSIKINKKIYYIVYYKCTIIIVILKKIKRMKYK